MMMFRSRIYGTLAAVAALTLVACERGGEDKDRDEQDSSASASAPAALPAAAARPVAIDPVPAAVAAVGHHAENAYDMAKLSDWAKARVVVDSLKGAAAQVDTMSQAGDQRASLRTSVAALDAAVTARRRDAALRESNHLTEVGAELARPFKPLVPTEVTLLDYYGRELEIWAAAGNAGKLRETSAAIRRTWDELRPQIAAHGGAAESARFDSLVTRVDAARATRDYAALATPVLDEVDNLEKVFTR